MREHGKGALGTSPTSFEDNLASNFREVKNVNCGWPGDRRKAMTI